MQLHHHLSRFAIATRALLYKLPRASGPSSATSLKTPQRKMLPIDEVVARIGRESPSQD